MPTYIEAATGRTIPASLALDANGRVRPGVSQTMGDGERLAFDLFQMDGARGVRSGSVFLTDGALPHQFGAPVPVTIDRSAVDAQRRRWLTDKATAHRADRQHAHARPELHQGFADRAPVRTAPSGRGAIEQARQLWLADKQNAHRRPQR